MGDEDEGDAGPVLDFLQFRAHMLAQFQIQRGQRLIQQQDRGFDGERTGDGHALLLAAGQFRRGFLLMPFQADHGEKLIGLGAPGGLIDTARFQAKGHVFPITHQWEKSEVLEDQGGGAFRRTQAAHVVAADQDAAFRRFHEPGYHAQDRRLAAAGRPQDGEEFPRFDRQVGFLNGGEASEPHHHIAQLYVLAPHCIPLTSQNG